MRAISGRGSALACAMVLAACSAAGESAAPQGEAASETADALDGQSVSPASASASNVPEDFFLMCRFAGEPMEVYDESALFVLKAFIASEGAIHIYTIGDNSLNSNCVPAGPGCSDTIQGNEFVSERYNFAEEERRTFRLRVNLETMEATEFLVTDEGETPTGDGVFCSREPYPENVRPDL